MLSCIPDILAMHRNSDAIALVAPDNTTLTFRQLYEHTLAQADALRAMGIHRHSRVAVVLPEGPELATSFLTVTQYAICVPVNPVFSESELINYFEDVGAKHLIVQAGEADMEQRATRLRDMSIIRQLNIRGEIVVCGPSVIAEYENDTKQRNRRFRMAGSEPEIRAISMPMVFFF